MQIEELREKIRIRLSNLVTYEVNRDKSKWEKSRDRVITDFTEEVMQLISDYVGGVIGEDEEENPKFLGQVRHDVMARIRNDLKETQRIKAGLSSIEESK